MIGRQGSATLFGTTQRVNYLRKETKLYSSISVQTHNTKYCPGLNLKAELFCGRR